ncbi:hypothetical protein BJF95_15670 [Rhizobium oryziradicis]|uniref:Uncharacterized protein n=1 Tax=Rhizobium oryziradicis TaxID=1867956 RepID=A0A1Q8ZXP0_9HYPH|nr:hypothetical protein BJF95_15670 [Rhizobium oryziradicis]
MGCQICVYEDWIGIGVVGDDSEWGVVVEPICISVIGHKRLTHNASITLDEQMKEGFIVAKVKTCSIGRWHQTSSCVQTGFALKITLK